MEYGLLSVQGFLQDTEKETQIFELVFLSMYACVFSLFFLCFLSFAVALNLVYTVRFRVKCKLAVSNRKRNAM